MSTDNRTPNERDRHSLTPHQPADTDCSSPGCCGEFGRRELLKAAGLGVAAAGLMQPLAAAAAGADGEGDGVIRHFVPADKKMPADWVRALVERGEPEVYRGKDLDTIGMPIGGITTGQLYLRGDGTLGLWQIFNRHHFSGYGAGIWRRRKPDAPVEQGFSITVSRGSERRTKRLDVYDFPDVAFRGEYPIGYVTYEADDFPVRIEMEAFSPFIPLNAKDSALPATLFHVTVENVSKHALSANLSAWLENAVCFHSSDLVHANRRSRIVTEKGRTLILHQGEKAPAETVAAPRPAIVLADFEGDNYDDWKVTGTAFGAKPATGTLPGQQNVSGFQGQGLVNTFLGGDDPKGTLTSPPFALQRKCLNFLIGGGNHKNQTCINLLVDGKVVRTATGVSNEKLTWHGWRTGDLEGKQAQIQIVDNKSGAWGHINIDQIEMSDELRIGPTGPIEKLEDFGTMALGVVGAAQAGVEPGSPHDAKTLAWSVDDKPYPMEQKRIAGMRTDPIELAPGAKHTYTCVLTWFFPNQKNGHQYNNHFANAADVANYVLDHHDRLAGDTRAWHDVYYDSTLPYWLLNRIGSTVSNLATGTCQWWANGRFWAWEGVGCCAGTCTHVWNYAHALARLFPELERSVRQKQDLGIALQADGKVHFRGEANRNYAADGQAGTVLKCYREHLMSADDQFLRRNWPNIRRVLSYSIQMDGNDDGLIENSQHNTFDINFFGPNTFVGSLYLAALRAGDVMAREMGETAFADRLQTIRTSGQRLSEDRLWNGEYFVQRVDLEKHPQHQYGEGCLSDQLFGQGWAHQLGLGYIYRPELVKQALESVYKYNWAPDVAPQNKTHKPERWFISPGQAGLFTCTWPKTPHLDRGVRYKNEIWTGIEYQVAGGMIWEGLLTEALTIVRAIHDRYHPSVYNPWNEVECGDHYARALASWGCLIALSGYEYHGPQGHLRFAPRMTPEDFRAAFTTAAGWGTFQQKRTGQKQQDRIEPRWGKLRLATLAVGVPKPLETTEVMVKLAGRPAPKHNVLLPNNGWATVVFDPPITLEPGQPLDVTIG